MNANNNLPLFDTFLDDLIHKGNNFSFLKQTLEKRKKIQSYVENLSNKDKEHNIKDNAILMDGEYIYLNVDHWNHIFTLLLDDESLNDLVEKQDNLIGFKNQLETLYQALKADEDIKQPVTPIYPEKWKIREEIDNQHLYWYCKDDNEKIIALNTRWVSFCKFSWDIEKEDYNDIDDAELNKLIQKNNEN